MYTEAVSVRPRGDPGRDSTAGGAAPRRRPQPEGKRCSRVRPGLAARSSQGKNDELRREQASADAADYRPMTTYAAADLDCLHTRPLLPAS